MSDTTTLSFMQTMRYSLRRTPISIFIVSFLRASTSIAPRQASSPGLSRVSRLPTPTSPPWSRRSAIGSSASSAILGYLEAGSDTAVATGYDPLVDDEPELARTLAASVQQRMAFGERAGQRVQRIGAGFGSADEVPTLTGPHCASVQGFSLHAHTYIPAHRRDQLECLLRYTARGAVSLERLQEDVHGDLVSTFTHPWSDGTTGITLSPLELLEKLAALVPLPRVHLVRYGGCLAPHSHLCGVIRPTPRQQGLDGEETHPGTPYWPWARLLGRVFGLDMRTCPFCRRGSLRIIAVITQESVITRILRHLQLTSVP